MDKYNGVAQTSAGDLITSGAPTIRVTSANSDTLVPIYSSDSLSDTKANPFTLPPSGKIEFHARNGKVRVKMVNGVTETILEEVVMHAGGTAGLFSARPAAGSADRLYFATDQGRLYRDNGTSWETYPDFTLDAMDWSAAADVTAAATTNVFSGTGNFVEITGAATITAMASGDAPEGSPRLVRFAGICTLTYGVNLELHGGVDWTTVAGDMAWVIGKGGSQVRVIPISISLAAVPATTTEARAGTSQNRVVTPKGLRDAILLSSASAAGVAQVDISLAFPGYRHFLLELDGVRPATDGALLHMRVSEDAGVSFKSGASDYVWTLSASEAGTTTSEFLADSEIQITGTAGIDNGAAGSGLAATIKAFAPVDTARHKRFNIMANFAATAGGHRMTQGGAIYQGTVNAINALRFLMSAGNIAAGTFNLYGIP